MVNNTQLYYISAGCAGAWIVTAMLIRKDRGNITILAPLGWLFLLATAGFLIAAVAVGPEEKQIAEHPPTHVKYGYPPKVRALEQDGGERVGDDRGQD